jgi:hypothetical protein
VPEATALRLITDALPFIAKDDDETVERSAFLYDACTPVWPAGSEQAWTDLRPSGRCSA